MSKVHAVNGATTKTFCGREPESVEVTDGLKKVTCAVCARVVEARVAEMDAELAPVVSQAEVEAIEAEAEEDAEYGEWTPYLEHRCPGGFTEIRFTGLSDHHREAIYQLSKLVDGLPEVEADWVGLMPIGMIGIKERLEGIKLELSSAWSLVATVRGAQCPSSMMPLRHMLDVELAAKGLQGAIERGTLSLEDLSWALRVSNELGEPGSSLDEQAIKMADLNEERNLEEVGGNITEWGVDTTPFIIATWMGGVWESVADISQLFPALEVDVDSPLEVEGTMSTEGTFGQLQVSSAPQDLSWDLWLEHRTSEWTDRKGFVHENEFWDPQGDSKAAIFAVIRDLVGSRLDQAEARGGRLVWKTRGFTHGLSAACRVVSDKAGAPWEFALPVEAVYEALAARDEAFGQLWEAVKKFQLGCPGWDEPVHLRCHKPCPKKGTEGYIEWMGSWRTKMRMVRMWSVLEHGGIKGEDNQVQAKHLVVKVWVHKDTELRAALGQPSATAHGQRSGVEPPSLSKAAG